MVWPREPRSCPSPLASSTHLSQGSDPQYPGKCSREPAGESQGREDASVRSVPCPLTVCGRQSPLNPRWDSPVVPGCRGTSHCTAPLQRRPRVPAGRGHAGGAAVGWGRSGPADGDARQVLRDGSRLGGGETQVQSPQQGGWRWDPEDRPCAKRARFPVGQKYTLSTEGQTPTPPTQRLTDPQKDRRRDAPSPIWSLLGWCSRALSEPEGAGRDPLA